MILAMRVVFLSLLKVIASAWLVLGATLLLLIVLDRLLAAALPPPQSLPMIDPQAVSLPLAEADAIKNEPWLATYRQEREASKDLRWVPYRYWQRAPFSGQTIQIDEAGVRLTVQKPTAVNAKKLWLFGGSTMWGAGTPDGLTIPSLLASSLNDSHIEITNFGESGYVTTQSLLRLMELLKAGERPDWVIFYDGANDVFSALQNDQAGLPQNEANRALEFNVSRDGGKLTQLLLNGMSGITRVLADAAEPPEIEPLAESIARDYGHTLRMLEALANAYGFEYLAVWQPTLFSKTTLSPSERAALGSRPIAHLALSNAAHAAIRQKLGAHPHFVDLYGVLDDAKEPLFLDFCHLGPAGNRLVAAALAEQWLKRQSAPE